MSDSLKKNLTALAGFLIVSLIFTFPLIFNFTSKIPGPPEDNLGFLWNMWWLKHTLIEGKGQLFFTDYMFYPNGLDLSFNSFAYFKTGLSLPLQYLFDWVTIHNLLLILSYVLSGFGVYLLVSRLAGRPGVGFVSGLIYSLAPTHVWHLDHHLDVGSIEMIPFFLFFFIRYYEERHNKDLILAGVFFALTSLSCWYYMMYLFYFLLIFFAYFLIKEREQAKTALKGTSLMMGGGLAAISPFLYPLIAVKFSGKKYLSSPSSFNCVTDLAAPFVPSGKHPLAGWLGLDSYYKSLPCFPWETNVFIGYTVLLLAVYGFMKAPGRWTRFMAVMGGVFWVLALGSHLQLGGQPIFENLLLPYYWLVEKIPMAGSMRVPARFMVMVMLSLAVLAGYGLNYLLTRRDGRYGNYILVLAGVLIFGEFMSYPYKMIDLEQVTQAKYLARNLPGGEGEYAVLELPITKNYVINELYIHRQIRHRKKILGGATSREPVGLYDFIARSPLSVLMKRFAQVDYRYFQSLKPFLEKNGIKFIVFNRYLFPRKYADFLEGSLRRVFPNSGQPNPKVGIYQVY